MLFSSPIFLYVFLPILLGLYAIAPPRCRNLVLLTASLLFYVWGEGAYVVLMIAIIAVNYGLGRRVEMLAGRNRAKITVAVAVIVNLGLLIAFKYSNFLVDQLNVLLSVWRSTTHQAGAGASAAGDLVLHVSCDLLRRRHSPAQNPWGQAARLRPLHDTFSAFDRRADRSLWRHRRPDRAPGDHDGGVCGGNPAVHHRAGQEDAGGEHGRGRGRCHLCAARPRAELQPGVAGGRLLHASDLL